MSRLIFSRKILIGCSCSWMGMKPGRKSAVSIAEKLVNDLFVRIVTLPEGIDPDHADEGTLGRLLGASQRR